MLDGRWLHAFNGPGMGAQVTTLAINGNNVQCRTRLTATSAITAIIGRIPAISPGVPAVTAAMDEDYDACDLENWFLAIQSADGQVMIPSFHRPAIIRYDPNSDASTANDWQNVNQ